ncbi:MFS transporter [Maribacter polysiphoniae]|uniref:MFS transporter n=1 Tax=Maribacter polysiphoniae TaxID=429344 RepID=A0A316E1J6_9FLAO|nr:MFS transporter [Maribacter polysiphoniae]MBD1260867.1 MFS transporter [Maribacter polysiphoniae]PWK23995.1 MFS transporter [Maribacter polysiphoniae]
MELSPSTSKRNFNSLLWHAAFLSLAQVFMDVDTIIPAMLVDAGGSAIQIGILTAIMLGGSSFSQLLYAPFVSNNHFKKKFLLIGINSRIFALLGLALMLYFSSMVDESMIIWMIFILISIFSFGGAFANLSYTDILGKSIIQDTRKSFFSSRQVIKAIILFFAALLAKKIFNLADYPVNYGYMFFIAFAALLISSLGFWNIKEVTPSRLSVKSPKHFFQLITTELQQNKKLKYFLGYINTMGISIALLPFVILYAKEFYLTDSSDTGSFLLYKIIGSIIAGSILFILAKRYKYQYLLYGSAVLAFALPLLILLATEMPSFVLIFFIGGIIYTTYTISMNGVLLEVSGTENRTLYTGITGIGNILPALFPMAGGWIIHQFGFQVFFILFMFFILCSLFFIYKLDCKK